MHHSVWELLLKAAELCPWTHRSWTRDISSWEFQIFAEIKSSQSLQRI